MELNITESDTICTNYYNSHLEIIAKSEQNSHDYELRALLSSLIINQFPEYISLGLKNAILKLGDILLKKVAILLSELYYIVIKQSMTKVSEMNLVYTEHLLRQEMHKRCFLNVLLNYFGKHLTSCCKQQYIDVLLYQSGTSFIACPKL